MCLFPLLLTSRKVETWPHMMGVKRVIGCPDTLPLVVIATVEITISSIYATVKPLMSQLQIIHHNGHLWQPVTHLRVQL